MIKISPTSKVSYKNQISSLIKKSFKTKHLGKKRSWPTYKHKNWLSKLTVPHMACHIIVSDVFSLNILFIFRERGREEEREGEKY